MATDGKDLRTGQTIWTARHARTFRPHKLTRNLSCDVLVIGAGISGAMIADRLAAASVDVVVVDKRAPAAGATAASTALVQYEIDTPLTRLSRKIGKDKAARAWRRSRLALETLAARLGELDLPDVARRSSLYLAGNLLDREALEREHDARRAIGLASRLLTARALRDEFGITRRAALLSYGNFVVDPRKTTLALLRAATENGARLFFPCEVTAVHPGRSSVTASTDGGHAITCRQLIYATGYEQPDSISRRDHKIISTWAIATKPQARGRLWPGECCIWEAADPYLYVRTTPQGHVICGGEDEDFEDEARRDALITRKTETLRRKLKKLLPRISTEVRFRWTGSFGETSTGLPIIGRIPGEPHCWTALGYGGNGTTYAAIAADVIAGAVIGRADADADLYDFPAHKAAR